MKLYIPEIGDTIALIADWTFDLHCESRNDKFLTHNKLQTATQYWKTARNYNIQPPPSKVTLPTGTELTIDRIYIRKGAEDFSSITFRTTINKVSYRFWVKLKDANNIEFDPVTVKLKVAQPKIELPHGWNRNHYYHNYYDSTKEKISGIQSVKKLWTPFPGLNATLTFNQITLTIKGAANWVGKSTYDTVVNDNFQYTLTDDNGTILGSWTTSESLVKYLKKHAATL